MKKASIGLLAGACAVSAFLLLPAGAAAQSFPCRGTPGERQVGMAGGNPRMAPFPICVADPAPGGGRDAMGASASKAASYDPVLDAMVHSVMIRQKQLSTEMARQAALDEKLARDPAFRRLHLGAWDLFQADPKARPGDTCTAVWSKQGQMVSISGPGRQYEGGMLTFLGRDIPQPADMQTLSVTMKQSRYPAQTVQAVNYTLPGVAFGALSLTVPDIGKAIDTMLDVEQFELLIDGKRVASIGWSGGHEARDKLRRCVQAR